MFIFLLFLPHSFHSTSLSSHPHFIFLHGTNASIKIRVLIQISDDTESENVISENHQNRFFSELGTVHQKPERTVSNIKLSTYISA